MKNIAEIITKKYKTDNYTEIEPGVFCDGDSFVTTLGFTQEERLGEGSSSKDISQYPLEDIFDEFNVYVSDFYSELNNGSDNKCVLEFCSNHLGDIRQLRSLIGKHVYNKSQIKDGKEYVKLVIE